MTSPLKRLFHWGPLASMGITAALIVSTLSTRVDMIWILIFQITMCLTLYYMWCATLIGPGYISPAEPSPTTNTTTTTKTATKTTGQPTSEVGRFCRRCCHIVLKKHHHCPWINNCVGQYNEQYFLKFLYFAIAVSIQSAALLIIDTCRHNYSSSSILFNVLNIALAIGVFVSLSVLLYTH